MVGARPGSRPILGVTFDPSEDHALRVIVAGGGYKWTQIDGAFVAEGDEGRDSQLARHPVDVGLRECRVEVGGGGLCEKAGSVDNLVVRSTKHLGGIIEPSRQDAEHLLTKVASKSHGYRTGVTENDSE